MAGSIETGRIDDFAHAIDFFPTIAAAPELETPANLPGINLVDAKARKERERVFGVPHAILNVTVGAPDDSQQYLWCVEGDWKLILRFHGQDTTRFKAVHAWDTSPARLFNLKTDPHEKNDQAKKHPVIVEPLKKTIADWHRSAYH